MRHDEKFQYRLKKINSNIITIKAILPKALQLTHDKVFFSNYNHMQCGVLITNAS